MKTFCYKKYCTKTVKKFISKSTPIVTDNFHIIKGEENAGWIDISCQYADVTFTVTQSLVLHDLTELVEFFESMIDLKQEMSLFLDDELVSEPLLYATSIDKENARLLIADHKRAHDNWKNYGIKYNSQISNYDIKCDVIINKKELLKDFAKSIQNIIKMNDESESKYLYDICYDNWAKKFERILKCIK